MNTQLKLANHNLFDRSKLSVTNVKLFPGSNRDATPEQVAEQINRAIVQIENGDYDPMEGFDD